MGRMLKHMLIFLLIILKEFHMSEASCSCSSSSCTCTSLGLTSVPQNLPTDITYLNFNDNQITTINQSDFSRYTNLINLYLNNNDISSIEAGTFSHTSQLQRLYLNGNNLTSIPQGVFNNLNEIQRLYIVSNLITHVLSGAFSNLPQLQQLHLYSNKITHILSGGFSNLPQLQQLHLYSNQITHIQSGAFSNLPQLQQLYLYSNQITHIQSGAFSNFPELVSLQLQGNKLSSIPTIQYQLPKLSTLDLNSNNITDIPAHAFSNQPKLSTLQLDSNRISTVSSTAFRGLNQLYGLYLSNNELTELPDDLFFGLSNLGYLELQNNAILQIFPNTFTGTSSLVLDLSGNNIKTFPIEALLKTSLDELYLENNQMTTLPLTAYDMLSSVFDVDITNNPWQCDCRMVGFRQKMTGTYDFEYFIRCTDSQNRGLKLGDINPEDLTCEEPMIVRFEKSDGNSVVEGGTLRLFCEASGTPTPDITVILPSGLNVTVESGGRVTVDVNGTITVTDVTAADAGLYICIAASPVGSMFETLSVDVQPKVPPTVTMAPLNITDKPESTSNHGSAPSFSLPVLLGSVIGAVAGTVLIVGIILMIWFKRRAQNPAPGPDASVVFSNTNTTVTVKTSGHGKKGQGQSNPDLYEDVDYVNQSPSNQNPKGAGPKGAGKGMSNKKKAATPANRNKAPDVERPPLPPPLHTGAGAGVYANEPAAAPHHDDNQYYLALT